MKPRVALQVLRIQVTTIFYRRFCYSFVAVLAGDVEQGVAKLILKLWVKACLEGGFYFLVPPMPRGAKHNARV
eukprot:CAMPEP_0195029380 /NCGR_PEP_ID=MMETSP0326_2-20130528/56477_1 /TAXON_ID=2866 ORGANISM="Crypthecodinium cohnii, Strain Seligo" /NCGR_SAMPLE_ID=MMETSP0326_2 /ASSEMBLY_ACC=CAM_ASM_000348 /LENGTH=72 /DNA_ID=CAMNT_0040052247 /DNA_START=148 /DNA_END=366 /DNA_ORIENTATION=+